MLLEASRKSSALPNRPIRTVPPPAPPARSSRPPHHALRPDNCSTVQMVGFDNTFFGVGGPEVAVVLVVGYFVLGPVELVKLVKQAGILVGQLRDVGLGTVTNLSTIMDDQVCLCADKEGRWGSMYPCHGVRRETR